MKQNMRAQASTQDSLRVAVSHLDKQVQVLPSTLAKQLAHPPEQHEALPKTSSEAASAQQQQQAQQGEVAEKQLTSWSQALEQQSDSEATLAARAAFLQQGPQVPLSRQLIEGTKPVVAAAPPDSKTQQQQQQPQPAVPASAGEPAAPQATVVQVVLPPLHFGLTCCLCFVQHLHHGLKPFYSVHCIRLMSGKQMASHVKSVFLVTTR